jgi:hypothetical protein
VKYVNGRQTGLVTFYVETAIYNGLLKERYKGDRGDRKQGRRRRKLLDDLKERRGYSHLKEKALDRTMWKARFGRGFGPVVRQTTKLMNEYHKRCTRIINPRISVAKTAFIRKESSFHLHMCRYIR